MTAPDHTLAARLAELSAIAVPPNPSIKFALVLIDVYRSGQLITLADHEAAVADARLEMINSLKDEIARQEGEGGEGSSLWCIIDGERTIHEIRAQERMDARVQAAVAKAVEAEREACANEVILQYKLWEDYGAAGFDDLCIAIIPAAIRARKGDAL